MTPFYKALRIAREKRDMTQAELGNKVGKHSKQISAWECAGTALKPNFQALRKLADALEVSADYLLGRSAWTDERFVKLVEPAAKVKEAL